ncbi:MAG: MmcQ/YjbR family DNA-binding protein [Dehalococcoidia bacterium]
MDPEVQRARVREICLAFPEATEQTGHSDHSAFLVNGKKFCYFLNNHHGDGIVGITCKTLPGVQAELIDLDRERFYLPAYVARHGWIGMRLDIEPVDWAQAEQLLTEAYTATAPKRIVKQFEAARPSK